MPLVLGLDEVDLMFQHPEIATDFFGLLRAWHEKSKNEEIWKRLRLKEKLPWGAVPGKVH